MFRFHSKPVQKPVTQLELDHQRLLKQEHSLRKDMGKQRVKQLKMANEDEDKTIHKLEKLLKIDKSKSKKKGIPRMFNDGLDYALEMCLPENIEKMYAAAKEAADADQQSDSEWQEDFALATGELETMPNEQSPQKKEKPKQKTKQSTNSVADEKQKATEKKKAERLREIESKYFGASDDELASDLSDVDSEFERGEDDEDSEGNMDSADSDDSDDAPEEIKTKTTSSRKRKLEKSSRKAAKEPDLSSEEENFDDNDSEDSDMDEFDEDEAEDGDSDGSSDDLPMKKVRKSSTGMDEGSEASEQSEDSESEKKPDVWEDIYGRTRDKDGNIIKEQAPVVTSSGKYVPPHMRARLAAEASTGDAEGDMDPKRKEKLMRLKRLLKGQLNRLSEANMHRITSELDNLYMQNSRHDMNTTLTALIRDALITHVLAPERMVMEHALLIAALHANVGTEVGANLLESLVDRFHQMIENGIEQYDVEDKTLDNVIFVMCHMYTFKVSYKLYFICVERFHKHQFRLIIAFFYRYRSFTIV